MLLTIDAGNTRTKWAIFNAKGEITHQGVCLNTTLQNADLSASTLGYARVVISNVAGHQHATAIQSKLAPQHPIQWLLATKEACDLINHYTNPSSLGSDRWAALVAAWHLQHAPCIVVNAGTAVTIDAIVPQAKHSHIGEFIGGMIIPGLDLMQQSLHQSTAQLPKVHRPQNHGVNVFATSTEQAIYAGSLNAITGAIERMAHTLAAQCAQMPNIIISGGNAQETQANCVKIEHNRVSIIDTLVLQGLFLLDSATHNSTKSETV